MALDPHLGIAGLCTEPNPHTPPPGALRVALNTVVRRPGVIEPRPGFKVGTDVGVEPQRLIAVPPDDGAATGIIAVGATTIMASGGDTDEMHSYAFNGPALQWDSPDNVRGASARKAVYLTTLGQMHRTRGTTYVASPVGQLPPTITDARLYGAGTALVASYSVAYRAVLERTYATGLVVTSAPSGRCVVRNNLSTTQDVEVTYSYRDSGIITADGDTFSARIKIYRSLATTGDVPDDDMYLVRSIELSAYSESRVVIVDSLPESGLGEELYTNGGREGPFAANFRPPPARDVALYNRSLFFAGITDFARAVLRWTNAQLLATAEGIGYRTVLAPRVQNSADLVVDTTVGLQVGMLLSFNTDWDAETSGPNRIVAIDEGTSTVTMAHEWLGPDDGAPVTLTFLDSICIGEPTHDESYYPAHEHTEFIDRVTAEDATDLHTKQCVTAFAYCTGTQAERLGGVKQFGARSVVLEAISATETLQICATHGDEYDPPLPLISAVALGGDAAAYAPETRSSSIGWSKSDQPEHYALSSDRPTSAIVGDANAAILRIIATRDALWILKARGDGIYRLGGNSDDEGFRIDKFDPSTYLLSPELACAHEDIVFAWCNKGFVAISDAGVEKVSGPRVGSELLPSEAFLETGTDMPVFAVPNSKSNEVLFGLPAPQRPSIDYSPGTDVLERPAGFLSNAAGIVYCYNSLTRVLTSWFGGTRYSDSDPIEPTCAAVDPASGALLFGELGEDHLLGERSMAVDNGAELPSILNADRVYAITIDAILDDTNVLVLGGGTEAFPGDIITQGPPWVYALVLESLGDSQYRVQLAPIAAEGVVGFVPGPAERHEYFTSAVIWAQQSQGVPAIAKVYQSVTVHWDSLFGTLAMQPHVFDVEQDEIALAFPSGRPGMRCHQPAEQRCTLELDDVGHRTRLVWGLKVNQADSRWRISGMTVAWQPLSERVPPITRDE